MGGKRLAAVVIFILIAAAMAITSGIYTNGFESLSSLYVAAGGEIYSKDAEIAVTGDDIQFEVKGAGFGSEHVEYTVQALASAEYAFVVDGEVCIWNGSDVTDKLITLTDTGFTFTPLTTAELIALIYAYEQLLPEVFDGSGYDYTVTVTSANGKKAIKLTFTAAADPDVVVEVEDIEITPDHIIY